MKEALAVFQINLTLTLHIQIYKRNIGETPRPSPVPRRKVEPEDAIGHHEFPDTLECALFKRENVVWN